MSCLDVRRILDQATAGRFIAARPCLLKKQNGFYSIVETAAAIWQPQSFWPLGSICLIPLALESSISPPAQPNLAAGDASEHNPKTMQSGLFNTSFTLSHHILEPRNTVFTMNNVDESLLRSTILRLFSCFVVLK